MKHHESLGLKASLQFENFTFHIPKFTGRGDIQTKKKKTKFTGGSVKHGTSYFPCIRQQFFWKFINWPGSIFCWNLAQDDLPANPSVWSKLLRCCIGVMWNILMNTCQPVSPSDLGSFPLKVLPSALRMECGPRAREGQIVCRVPDCFLVSVLAALLLETGRAEHWLPRRDKTYCMRTCSIRTGQSVIILLILLTWSSNPDILELARTFEKGLANATAISLSLWAKDCGQDDLWGL